MSTTEATGASPEFGLRHRMALALEVGGVSVGEMAEELSLHRVTVSGWMHGRSNPPVAALKIWALRTGVSYHWLITGEIETPPPPRKLPKDAELTAAA